LRASKQISLFVIIIRVCSILRILLLVLLLLVISVIGISAKEPNKLSFR